MQRQPEQLGRYLIRGPLGVGGFATVYRAWDEALHREVALKVLHPHLAADPEIRRRFVAEARTLAQLRHPHIITVFDVGEAAGRPFFAMELLEGATVAALSADGHRWPLTEVVTLLRNLAAALDYVHGQGFVHRDIKGANLMVEEGGRVVLMDLGIARALNTAQMTAASALIGTPEAMAPEQARGLVAGPAADIYALGVLAFRLLSGRPPFAGDLARLVHAHAFEPPPLLAEVCPDLPSTVSSAVDAALAKDPAQRPASAGAFVELLGTPKRPARRAAARRPPARPKAAAPEPPPEQTDPTIAVVSTRAEPLPPPPAATLVASTPGNAPAFPPVPRPAPVSHAAGAARPSGSGWWAVLAGIVLAVVAGGVVLALRMREDGDTATPRGRYVTDAIVTTLAGNGSAGFGDGPTNAASFSGLSGITVDGATIIVTDSRNQRLRTLPYGARYGDGAVATLAGGATAGLANGPATSARFNTPTGVARAADGTLYVADQGNHVIRMITPGGAVATFAGAGQPGFADGPAARAQFNSPAAVAIDGAGNVYVADALNGRVRKITPQGIVSTVAGGTCAPILGSADRCIPELDRPGGIAVDSRGTVYVADTFGHRIRRISGPNNLVTVAGTVEPGYADGPATTARFSEPRGLAIDGAGTIYVADRGNARIRQIAPDGTVMTLAGSGGTTTADGPGAAAGFSEVVAVAVAPDGAVLVAEPYWIRRITRASR